MGQYQGPILVMSGEPDDLNIIAPVDGVAQRIQLYGDPEPNVIYLEPASECCDREKRRFFEQVRSAGNGLLLVNGALSIEGGFNWYGLIIATGGVNSLAQEVKTRI